MTKEGDVAALKEQDFGQSDAIITAPPPQLPSVSEQSHIENCKKLVDALQIIVDRTMDHFVKDGSPHTRFKRKDKFDGVEKSSTIYGKPYYVFQQAFYEADIVFKEENQNSNLKQLRIGIGGRAMNGYERLGTFRAPFERLAIEIQQPDFQSHLARYAADIVSKSDRYFNQNQNDTPRIKEIAQSHVQDALQQAFSPKPETSVAKASDALRHVSQNEFQALGDALTQTIERTFDDLLTAGGRRPKLKMQLDLNGAEKSIKFSAISKNRIGIRIAKDFQFTIRFNTKHDAQLLHSNASYHEGPLWGHLSIPLNNSESSITDVLDSNIIALLEEKICDAIQFNDRILTTNNKDQASRLKEIVTEHLKYALAGAFGSDLNAQGQSLELATFDEAKAEGQFREEIKQLQHADKNDVYLLTVFGMAAMQASATDVGIINEWETARAFSMPPTLNKIRHINKTLKELNAMDENERAANARELLSQIRSMQKTFARDLEVLSEDAKSIHGAKTVVKAHEENLTKYVQSFAAARPRLNKVFGEAAIADKAGDLRTALSAAQIHLGAQSVAHEGLSNKMLKHMSSLSTRMALVSQSMSRLATNAVEAQMNGSNDELEDNIKESIDALVDTLDPISQDIDDVEKQLALNNPNKNLLLLTHHREEQADIAPA